MKTAELTGAALDWAVAKCEGKKHGYAEHLLDPKDLDLTWGVAHSLVQRYRPSVIWSQGGPIIEREKIATDWSGENDWCASCDTNPTRIFSAATPLIAAMRCYVASKLGDTVDTPKELT